jgi:pimeloyl-ACP methyl ester carboxylesterase
MLKFTAVAAVASFAAASSATVKHAQHAPTDFDWETISPSWDLHFTSCYDEFQCARLLVPVDWLEEDTAKRNSKTMAIAVIRMPANLTDASSHGGAVIVNPGGPGNSGIQEILTNGHFLRNLVDSSHKRFDVMSFDPRGMGSSTPAADCFASEAERQLYNAQSLGALLGGRETDLSDASVARKRANAQALGHKCMLPGPDGYVVQEFMSTASVARDMLQIVDKLENLRMVEKSSDETEIGLDGRKGQAPLGNADATKSKEDAGDEVRNLPRLQYLGLSYGTMLGNTFISMFPERVKRMVLDGVIVPEDYTAGVSLRLLLKASFTHCQAMDLNMEILLTS